MSAKVKAELCKFHQEGKCKFGEKCTRTHAVAEKKAPAKAKHNQPPAKQGDVVKKRTFNTMLKAHNEVVQKKNALLKEQQEFNRKYVITADSKDTKSVDPFTDRLKFFDDQLKASREAMRSMWGNKAFKIQIPVALAWNANGSNTLAATQTVDPTPAPEWISMSSIFDEYKVEGIEYHFACTTARPPTASMALYGAIAFDPTDSTIPSSALSLMSLEQHMLVPITVENPGGTSPWFINTGKPLCFRAKPPPGVITPTLATWGLGSGQWQPTDSGTFFPYGWLKTYAAGITSTVAAFTGILYYHVEFRCRT